jgi:gluconolactonase
VTLQTVATGLEFPEGPVALANGDVLVVEVMGGRLTRIAPDGQKTVVAQTGGGPNGAALGPNGACIICNNGGMGPSHSADFLLPSEAPFDTPPGCIQSVDLASGAVATLYAHTDATPFWGPNDLVFDAAGGFWFTDFGRDRGHIRQRGSVYYATPDGGSIREAIRPMDGPNGIGLSPDGRTLYVAETFSGHVWAFALIAPGQIDADAGQGMLPGGRILSRSGPGQFLDSLAVDSAGNICVASPGHGAILVFSPDGGPPETIAMPDFLTTNIAFGGPDLSTAVITLGSSGRLVSMPWPRPGLRLHGQ